MQSIRLNQIISHLEAEAGSSVSTEDLDAEEDDG